jgi:hypothetical protein
VAGRAVRVLPAEGDAATRAASDFARRARIVILGSVAPAPAALVRMAAAVVVMTPVLVVAVAVTSVLVVAVLVAIAPAPARALSVTVAAALSATIAVAAVAPASGPARAVTVGDARCGHGRPASPSGGRGRPGIGHDPSPCSPGAGDSMITTGGAST